MDETEEIVEKLRAVLVGDPKDLSPHELKKLRAMIATYDMFLSSGKLGKWIIGGAILTATFITAMIKLLDYAQAALRAQ